MHAFFSLDYTLNIRVTFAQVAITELRLLRTLERVETLETTAKWSFKQPKKQRNLGGIMKTHWDYLLDEMVCILFCTSCSRGLLLSLVWTT